MVKCGFNIDCECCDDMFGFRVSGCDDCDECELVLWFRMGEMFVVNILVDMVVELNF